MAAYRTAVPGSFVPLAVGVDQPDDFWSRASRLDGPEGLCDRALPG